MCIIIVVPTRNVYVSEDDLDLFAEATEIAGGLSAAVLEALRSYVDRHHRAAGGFDEIELELQNDGIDHRVTFMGRRLIHIRRCHQNPTTAARLDDRPRAHLVRPGDLESGVLDRR